MVNPSVFIGEGVAPSFLNFVVSSPHERSINMGVEALEGALRDGCDIVVREGGGVLGALAVLDHVVRGVTGSTIAKWSVHLD